MKCIKKSHALHIFSLLFLIDIMFMLAISYCLCRVNLYQFIHKRKSCTMVLENLYFVDVFNLYHMEKCETQSKCILLSTIAGFFSDDTVHFSFYNSVLTLMTSVSTHIPFYLSLIPQFTMLAKSDPKKNPRQSTNNLLIKEKNIHVKIY